SAVKATLQRGELLTIGLVLFGDDITWCAVSRSGETRRLGFVSCEFLEPDRGSGGAPSAAKPKPAPITIRDAPPELVASVAASAPIAVPVVPPPPPAMPPPAPAIVESAPPA